MALQFDIICMPCVKHYFTLFLCCSLTLQSLIVTHGLAISNLDSKQYSFKHHNVHRVWLLQSHCLPSWWSARWSLRFVDCDINAVRHPALFFHPEGEGHRTGRGRNRILCKLYCHFCLLQWSSVTCFSSW